MKAEPHRETASCGGHCTVHLRVTGAVAPLKLVIRNCTPAMKDIDFCKKLKGRDHTTESHEMASNSYLARCAKTDVLKTPRVELFADKTQTKSVFAKQKKLRSTRHQLGRDITP